MADFKNIKMMDLQLGNDSHLRNIDEGMSELVEHIKEHGLLEPLLVSPKDNGKYEIISGFRRFKALNILHLQIIPCMVVSETDEIIKKAMLFGKALTRNPLSEEDAIRICADLFEKYHDERAVASKTGISISLIKRYVKFARLPELIKCNLESIDENPKIAINLAVESADALCWSKDSDVPEDTVLELAKALSEAKRKSSEDYKKLKQAAEENPEDSLAQIEEKSLKITTPKNYNLVIDGNMNSYIEALAEKRGLSPEDLMMDALNDYIARDHSENND